MRSAGDSGVGAQAFPRRLAPGLAVVLAIAVALLFSPATRNEFVFLDDADYVTDNPHVRGGLTATNLGWAFTTFTNANWHPLTWVSHLLDVRFFGLEPAGHHLTSVALHAANTALLFVLLRALTGATTAAWLAAALFGCHPLRVESVAWVAERKDVLAAFFFLLALLAWNRYRRAPRRPRWYVASLLLFASGLMAKPMLVTFPFVLLLLDWWPFGRLAAGGLRPAASGPRIFVRLLVEKLPFFALSVASSVVTWYAQRAGSGLRSFEELPFGPRLTNALDAPVGYLAQTLWPAGLSVFYLHPLDGLPAWRPLLGGVLLLVTLGLVVRRGGRCPDAAVGWCWYLGTLVPVIGLVQVGAQARADRYTYLPQMGLGFLVLAAGRLAGRGARIGKGVLPAAAPLLVLLVAVLAAATIRQQATWKDSETLLRQALRATPENPVVALNLAVLQGRRGQYREAEATYRTVFRFAPRWRKAYYEHGILAVTTRNREAAVADYRALRALDPALAERLGRYLAAVGWSLPRD